MLPGYKFTAQDIRKRYVSFYGDDRVFTDGLIQSLRAKLSSLSEFVREIKVGFARYDNKRHNRRGYFWGDRFKSVIVYKGETPVKSAPVKQKNGQVSPRINMLRVELGRRGKLCSSSANN
jgi:hypothetical protein